MVRGHRRTKMFKLWAGIWGEEPKGKWKGPHIHLKVTPAGDNQIHPEVCCTNPLGTPMPGRLRSHFNHHAIFYETQSVNSMADDAVCFPTMSFTLTL